MRPARFLPTSGSGCALERVAYTEKVPVGESLAKQGDAGGQSVCQKTDRHIHRRITSRFMCCVAAKIGISLHRLGFQFGQRHRRTGTASAMCPSVLQQRVTTCAFVRLAVAGTLRGMWLTASVSGAFASTSGESPAAPPQAAA